MFQLAGVGDGVLTIEPMSMGPIFKPEHHPNNCTHTYTCHMLICIELSVRHVRCVIVNCHKACHN